MGKPELKKANQINFLTEKTNLLKIKVNYAQNEN